MESFPREEKLEQDDEETKLIKRCCIKRCKLSKPGEKVNLFAAPKEDEMFKKWAQTCRVSGTLLTKASYVCEKHFLPEQIKRSFILKDKAGNVVFKTPLNKFGLEEGAVPSIFDGKQVAILDTINYEVPSNKDGKTYYDSDNIEFMSNNNAFDHFLTNRAGSASTDEFNNGQKSDNAGKPPEPKKPDNLDKVIEEVVAYGRSNDGRKQEDENYVTHINNVAVKYDVIADAKEIIDTDLVNILSVKPFNILFNSTKDITLPSSLWGCHKSSAGQEIIVFSKVKWFDNEVPVAPVYEMQLVFYKTNIIKLFVYNLLAQIEIECPMSVEEMESILQQADNLKLCTGGPLVEEYPEAFPRNAFKDIVNRWRSKECPLIVSAGNLCSLCEKLYSNMKKTTHTDTIISRKKRKGKGALTEEERHAITSKINNLRSDILEMQCEITRLTNELE